MGSALDLWTAFREGAFNRNAQPFLGYFFMLEDCPASRSPVKIKEPHFKVFREFVGSSYAKRYELFCSKLVRERHYSAAAFITSQSVSGLKETKGARAALEFGFHQVGLTEIIGLVHPENIAPRRVLEKDGAWCERYAPCSGGTQVQLCVTDAGGHSWPGGQKRRGESPSQAVNANDLMWAFFGNLPR